ncbi:autophagy-related protein 11-domain-containing protein [Bisporella sp. PMI_857]|nr:autophagy-related protein 11-domain-containing protein [Bisporella sp. PMI_857]
MALLVLIAHTGQCLQVDPASFADIDAYRSWVAQQTAISVRNQISLTGLGRAVRFQDLSIETEVYVYDRRSFQLSPPDPSQALQSEVPSPTKYNVARPPDAIDSETDLQAWKNLFMARRTWALKVVEDTDSMAVEAQNRYEEINNILRAVDAAVLNLEKQVKALDRKNADIQNQAKEFQKDQELAGVDWESSLKQLRSLPAKIDIIKFVIGRDKKELKAPSLEDLVDSEDVRKAGKHVRSLYKQLNKSGAEVGGKVDEVLRRTDILFDKVENNPKRSILAQSSEPGQLMQDIEAIAKKITSDHESVLGYPNTSRSVSQASKSALHHTNNLLPNLSKRALEMNGLLRSVTEARNGTAADFLGIMHDIAVLTSMAGEANSRFAALDVDGDGFDAINLLHKTNSLPVIYASFVAEAIRRREWNDKVRSDSTTLANEMATFQDEESRRRRKWQKQFGVALWGDKAERNVIGVDVNLHGEEDEWPVATREDLEELIAVLQGQGFAAAVVEEVVQVLTDLNNPTKQQSKRAKAFKAGSIHDAALGRSALLLRGDDELIRSLRDDKTKAESKLKTAESRVRRLEDLLHRQSHINRTSTGNVFQLPGNPSPDLPSVPNPLASPRLTEDASRRSSASSRRFSATQGADERVFQQKLLSLEAELNAERERNASIEKELSARRDLVDEANSTNKDLMENFNAQQREFLEERKSLENEIKRLRDKTEELEDEMDRYLGSRENERSGIDDRVRALQDELDKVRRDAAAETQKAQGQVDFLRNDAKLQRETNELLEKELQSIRDERKTFLTRAEKAEALSNEQQKILHDLHSQLTKELAPSEDLSILRDVLINSAGDIISEIESIRNEAVIARSDRDSANATVGALHAELVEVKDRMSKEAAESSHLRDTLSEERAKFTALEGELSDERDQLSTLRTKILDGETGSEALRMRLEEEERKVTSMSENLASRLSRIGSLEEEVRTVQDRYKSVQGKYEKLSIRFEARTARAKDLTQRTYTQNDRLCRLLERLNYSITRDGGSMTIQKLPKPERSTASISGQANISPNARKSLMDSGDLDLLYWMHNDDSEVETERYQAYLEAIGSFDVEAFCEVITKRIKDVEFTGKKYLKDARSYREKSHAAQKEAHEKIAFKNFKEGDLALFLPTRNQATGAWAAFNIGAPHYFLREQDSHKLRSRDWLVARIHKIEDRVVDLSKSMSGVQPSDARSLGEASAGGESYEDDNPFDLSDGLRWYLIDAAEEKPGAPSTPGLGKSTVASANIDATGSIRRSKKSSGSGMEGINKTLSKSLDSRRSSTNSKKAIPSSSPLARTGSTTSLLPSTSVVEETARGQMIPTRSGPEAVSGTERVLKPEVRNSDIDDLLGPN